MHGTTIKKMTFLSYIYSVKQSYYELGSDVKYTHLVEGCFQRLATHDSLTLPRNVTEFEHPTIRQTGN
jgi:hypothetical protein